MALAFVNGTSGSNTNTPTAATAFAVTAGNTIILTISDDSGVGGNTYTITDTAGNTYVRKSIANSTSTAQIYGVANCLGNAANVISVAWNTGNTGVLTIVAQQFSGANTTNPFYATAFAGGTGTAPTANTAVAIAINDMVVGCLSYDATLTTTSLGTGYSNLTAKDIVGCAAAMESKLSASAVVAASPFTLAASENWIVSTIGLSVNNQTVVVTGHNLSLLGVGT